MGRVLKWWSEQTNRVYRSVIVVLGLDCIVVGIAESTGLYVGLGALFVAAALWWWD